MRIVVKKHAGVRKYDLNRYSTRLPWSTPQNSYSLLLQERRQAGSELLDLTITNPTHALADYPHAEIARAFGAIGDFQYEPDPLGSPAARRAIADWYEAQGIKVAENRIALTASTSEAYAMLFKLLCDPGDEVLIPNPSYPLFEYLARAEGVRTAPYRLGYDGGWYLDIDSARKALSTRSKAIIVVNPNNPTGSYLKSREVAELTALAAQHGCALVSDEVFMTYPAGAASRQTSSLIGNEGALCFSLNGLSKAAGMPQMKLGWIVVSGPKDEADAAMGRLELLLDSYLSPGTPVQKALPELLRIGSNVHAKIDARLWRNAGALGVLRSSPVQVLASESGWSAILQVPRVVSEEVWIGRLLAEHGVVVQPGYFFDMAQEAYLVVSLLADPLDFGAGIDSVKLVAQSL
jgi:aspartate/methionine/tyrosine aminotransferase